MSLMRDFFSDEVVLYFLYGLVFFILGFTVALQNTKISRFTLAKKIWLLALFGFIHGFAEWTHGYVYLKTNYFAVSNTTVFLLIEKGLMVLSYIFLFYFGLELFLVRRKHLAWLRVVPATLLVAWVVNFIYIHVILEGNGPAEWMLLGSLIARYTIALPASLLVAYVLFFEMDEIKELGYPHLERVIKTTATAFFAYAFFSGVVVPRVNIFPASYINKDSFLLFVGLPVEFFRMLSGLLITVSLIRSLKLFDLECKKKIEEAEKKEAIAEERERISRDLHDGILQSLYSVGLRLEHCRMVLKDHLQGDTRGHIDFSVGKLNEVMGDIRNYIKHLSLPIIKQDFRGIIEELVAEFGENNPGIIVELEIKEKTVNNWTLDSLNELHFMVKEALNNISKHAGASTVWISVRETGGSISIVVEDDGIGFNNSQVNEGTITNHYGLKNMAQRAAMLKGTVNIDSLAGLGTKVIFTLPKGSFADAKLV